MNEHTTAAGTLDAEVSDDLFCAYIGRNADRFISIRQRLHGNGLLRLLSWNWMALLFPVAWLLYRKLVWAAVCYLTVVVALMAATTTQDGGATGNWALNFMVGCMANALYVERVEAQVRKLSHEHERVPDLMYELERRGGTSIWGLTFGMAFYAVGLWLTIYSAATQA